MKTIIKYIKRIFGEKESEIKTNRGFYLYNFIDRYGNECSLQKSSLATEDCVWLGINHNRMHLTQKQIRKLLPKLNRFADKGEF